MNYEHLEWTELASREAYRCRVFKVRNSESRAADGRVQTFSVIDAPAWAIVVPRIVLDGVEHFVMVRQWRHGAAELSLEFPGGVVEAGEDPGVAAGRELAEETGWKARSIKELAIMSPNPAIMSNRVHIFAAECEGDREKQKLDADEYVDVELVPTETVRRKMGRPPYVHALMAAALAVYYRPGRDW